MANLSSPVASMTLRVCARLLCYPDAELRGHLPAMRDALHEEAALSAAGLGGLDDLIDALGRNDDVEGDGMEVEAAYVELFDRGRSTSLHLFEHVHGDSRDRGPAMIDLAQTYERAGLYLAPGELPDYLPAVLEFASTQNASEARAFLGEIAHILGALHTALRQRGSPYAAVFDALLELAGEEAGEHTIAPDAPLDESWAEPAAFGCDARPSTGNQQTIHFVRQNGPTSGVST